MTSLLTYHSMAITLKSYNFKKMMTPKMKFKNNCLDKASIQVKVIQL